MEETLRHLHRSGREFVSYFSHGTLSIELYAPRGTDKQTPHDRDEIYVVESGRGTFQLENSLSAFEKGDVLFVPAGKEHRFTRFSRNFSTWVFFYGPVDGERGDVRNLLLSHKGKQRMATLKTAKNKASVTEFLKGVKDPRTRKDCNTLVAMMKEATSERPAMWGTSIVGFGSYHYKYASGREGDWFVTGFSPRKESLTLYIMPGFDRYKPLMEKLGKFKTGKSCLYINSLEDVDIPRLRTLIRQSVREMRKKQK